MSRRTEKYICSYVLNIILFALFMFFSFNLSADEKWHGKFIKDGKGIKILEKGNAYQILKIQKSGRYKLSMKVSSKEIVAPGLLVELKIPHSSESVPFFRKIMLGNTETPILMSISKNMTNKSISVVFDINIKKPETAVLSLQLIGPGEVHISNVNLTTSTEAISLPENLVATGLLIASGNTGKDNSPTNKRFFNGDFSKGFTGWQKQGEVSILGEGSKTCAKISEGNLSQSFDVQDGHTYKVTCQIKTDCPGSKDFGIFFAPWYGKKLHPANSVSGPNTYYDKGGHEVKALLIDGGKHAWKNMSFYITPTLTVNDVKKTESKFKQRDDQKFISILRKIIQAKKYLKNIPESVKKGDEKKKREYVAKFQRMLTKFNKERKKYINDLGYGVKAVTLVFRKKLPGGAAYVKNISIKEVPNNEGNAQDAHMAAPLASPKAPVLSSGAVKELTLASGGKNHYRIYVGSDKNPTEYNAAVELATYLEGITGASFFPIAHDGNPLTGPYIILGADNKLAKLANQKPAEDLGDGGFTIQTKGKDLFIAGYKDRGTLYGVYHLLDNILGVRWYADDFTVVPKRATLKVNALNLREKPRLDYREAFLADSDEPIWAAHNRLNGRSHHRKNRPVPAGLGGFEFINRILPEKIIPKSLASGGQYKWSNPKTIEIASKAINKLAESPSYNAKYTEIIINDNGLYNQSGKDGKLIKEYKAPGSGHFYFACKVAENLKTKKTIFMSEAYQAYLIPPMGMKYPSNAGTQFAPIQMDFGKPYTHPDNKVYWDALKGWAKVTDTIIIWDYITNFSSYIQPQPNIYILGDNIRAETSLPSVKGIFFQGSYGTVGGEFANLRTWLIGRLTWNPKQDDKALIDEFLKGYYGPAAPFIKQYLDLIHDSLKKYPTYLAVKTGTSSPYLNVNTLIKANELFDKAEASVANFAAYSRHVKVARLGVDYVCLSRRSFFREKAKEAGVQWNYNAKKRMKAFQENLKLGQLTKVGESSIGKLENLIPFLQAERQIPPIPQMVRSLKKNEWIDIQETAFNLTGANIVPDNKADDLLSASLGGGKRVWGIRYFFKEANLKPGKWKVYVRMRVQPNFSADFALDEKANGIHLFARNKKGSLAGRPVTFAEIIDNEYHYYPLAEITVPMKDDAYLVVTGGSNKTDATFVDRLILIKQK